MQVKDRQEPLRPPAVGRRRFHAREPGDRSVAPVEHRGQTTCAARRNRRSRPGAPS